MADDRKIVPKGLSFTLEDALKFDSKGQDFVQVQSIRIITQKGNTQGTFLFRQSSSSQDNDREFFRLMYREFLREAYDLSQEQFEKLDDTMSSGSDQKLSIAQNEYKSLLDRSNFRGHGTNSGIGVVAKMFAYNQTNIQGMNDYDDNALLMRLAAKGYPKTLKEWKVEYTHTAEFAENATYKDSDIDYIGMLSDPNDMLSKSNGSVPLKDIVGEDVETAIGNTIKSGKKMIVFTGAPGTGKTYSVEKYVDKEIGDNTERKEFVQFHSSFDYTDFVEGLRPVEIGTEMQFVRMDGIFKEFCRKAVNDAKYQQYLNAYKAVKAAEANLKQVEADLKRAEAETPEAKASEGNRLESAKTKLDNAKIIAKAELEKVDPYYFIIDEINRADLGRVFGELMYCFEKRGPEHRVLTQYSNLQTYDVDNSAFYAEKDDEFSKKKKGFFIPENVVVIGTMNDIDRSVETFDFAMRRRFDWVEIKADAVMRSSLESMQKNGDIAKDIDGLVGRIKPLNDLIKKTPNLGSGFMIGPAYFKGYGLNLTEEDKDPLLKIWEQNIRPILYEYMRGNNKAEKFVEEECWGKLFPNTPNPNDPNKPSASTQSVENSGNGN